MKEEYLIFSLVFKIVNRCINCYRSTCYVFCMGLCCLLYLNLLWSCSTHSRISRFLCPRDMTSILFRHKICITRVNCSLISVIFCFFHMALLDVNSILDERVDSYDLEVRPKILVHFVLCFHSNHSMQRLLQRFRSVYETQLKRGPPSAVATFGYATALIRSSKNDVKEGINLLESTISFFLYFHVFFL